MSMAKPMHVVVLYCQHCVRPEVSSATATIEKDGVVVRRVMMPCSSKLQASNLLKVLDDGADAVEVVACPEGACRFLVGSRAAAKRLQYACRLLAEAHVGGNRLGMSWKSGLSADALVELGLARAQALKSPKEGVVA